MVSKSQSVRRIVFLVFLVLLSSPPRTSLYGTGGGGSYDPTLGIEWWRDWDASYNYLPGVSGRPPFKMWTVGKIDNRLDGPITSNNTSLENINAIFAYEWSKIQHLIQAGYTGQYWEIGNESNHYPYFSPENYSYQFNLYCNAIKRLDSTAHCLNGGLSLYSSNWQDWTNQLSIHPDVWSIHPYDVFDDKAGQRSIDQIVSFRRYLDSKGWQEDTIWITEFGKGNWEYEPEENIVNYLVIVTDWLNQNHQSYRIERWFWWGVLAGDKGMGSNGLFYRDPYSMSTITPVGEAYLRQRDKWYLSLPIAYKP